MKDKTNNIFITTSCGWSGTSYEVCNGTSTALFKTDNLAQAEFAAHCEKNPDMLCEVREGSIRLVKQTYGTINKLITKNKLGRPQNKQSLAMPEITLNSGITIDLNTGQIRAKNITLDLVNYNSLSEALVSLKAKIN